MSSPSAIPSGTKPTIVDTKTISSQVLLSDATHASKEESSSTKLDETKAKGIENSKADANIPKTLIKEEK